MMQANCRRLHSSSAVHAPAALKARRLDGPGRPAERRGLQTSASPAAPPVARRRVPSPSESVRVRPSRCLSTRGRRGRHGSVFTRIAGPAHQGPGRAAQTAVARSAVARAVPFRAGSGLWCRPQAHPQWPRPTTARLVYGVAGGATPPPSPSPFSCRRRPAAPG